MFSDNLKKYRIEKGFSQNDIAEKLFVTRQCVSKWENGVTQPDLQTLSNLSELLGVSIDELIKPEDGSSHKRSHDINRNLFTVNALVAIFCLIAFVVVWRFMPLTIPAHWTHGEIDRYGSRNEILINMITIIVFFVIDIIVFFVLKHINGKRVIYFSHGTVALLPIAYFIIIVAVYAEYLQDILSFITCISVDFIMCVSVAMHPKISKQNYLLGVRTVETLSSAAVWNKTNALACYLFVGTSIVILVIDMIFIFEFAYLCLFAYLIPTIIAIVYSKTIYKNNG